MGSEWGRRGVVKTPAVLKRNLCLTLPQLDFNLVQAKAAKIGIPLTVLLRGWIEPQLKELRRERDVAD